MTGNSYHATRLDRRTFLKTTGAGASATALAGCLGGDDGNDVFRVGALYPLSGPVAETGQLIRDFVRHAVTVVNESHEDLAPLVLAEGEGLPNHGNMEVEAIFSDHRGEPDQGRAEAERLIQEENVDMLVGGYHSSVTQTMSAAAEREGIPHVNFESSSPDLTERGLEWFWRTGPHDLTFTQNMFEFFDGLNERQDAGLETVAIIHEDSEFGTISARAQEETAAEHGYEIVEGPISYTAEGLTSLESEILRIRDADPDILLPASYLRDAEILMNDMRDLDYFPPMVMAQNAGFNQPSFRDAADISDHVCTRSTYADDIRESTPEFEAFNDSAREATGESFTGVYIRSWGGFLSAMKGVDNAASTDPGDIQSAMNDLDLPEIESGLPFGINFAESGQNDRASGVLIQYEGGEGNMIWPFELAPNDVTFPAPNWDER